MAREAKQGFKRLATLEEAKRIMAGLVKEKENEIVSIEDSLGRVLARDIIAPMDVPHFRKSAMDGYAVIAQDTYGASNTTPKKLKIINEITAGQVSKKSLSHGECIEITTGAPLPRAADAVIMVEYTEKEKDEIICYNTVAPNENVIEIGSDIKKGSLVLRKGTVLNARYTGVIASLGIKNLEVKKIPKVAVLSTGDEILSVDEKLVEGKIYDINSRTLIDSLKEWNCEALFLGIAKDRKDDLKAKIIEGLKDADMMIISGGSSLGSEDLMVEVCQELGEVLVHGIAIKPGKPVLISKIENKLMLGLPGYPTSALSDFYILVVPMIHQMLGIKGLKNTVEAELSRKIASTIGRHEFLPVKIEMGKNGKKLAIPILKGSSAITSLSEADGFIEISENVEVLNKGEIVKVELFKT